MECAKGFLSDVVDTFADEAFVTLLVAIDTKAKADDELELAATLKLMTDRVPTRNLGRFRYMGTQSKESGNNVSFCFFSQEFSK